MTDHTRALLSPFASAQLSAMREKAIRAAEVHCIAGRAYMASLCQERADQCGAILAERAALRMAA